MATKDYLSIPELKKALSGLTEKELTTIIVDTYKKSEDVKQLLSVKFNRAQMIDSLFEQYEKQIEDEFFPDKGEPKLRLAHAKKAISTFKKMTGEEELTLELMLIYVENGVEFTNAYGDIDERFYASVESMYSKLIEKCSKDPKLAKKYKNRLEAIVVNTDGIGWGFHDGLEDLYYSLFEMEE